ncbi:MAG: TfoX/Sxy family protein, partial [Pseudomonadota bacterium]
MTLSERVHEVLHTLRPLGAIKARYQMGQTATIMLNDRVLGIVKDGNLYIKSDKVADAHFSRVGSSRFESPYQSWVMNEFPFRRIPPEGQHCSKAMI